MPTAPRKPTWSALKRKLHPMERPNLLEVIKALYELSAENRAFLAARFLSDVQPASAADKAVLRPYQLRIHAAFYEKGGQPRTKLNLTDARKGIRDYRKATSDLRGTLDLMLDYVETGTWFCVDFGTEDEPLFNSLSSVLGDLEALCEAPDGMALYEETRERLAALAEVARPIGWGYGDHVQDVVAGLEARWGKSGA